MSGREWPAKDLLQILHLLQPATLLVVLPVAVSCGPSLGAFEGLPHSIEPVCGSNAKAAVSMVGVKLPK